MTKVKDLAVLVVVKLSEEITNMKSFIVSSVVLLLLPIIFCLRAMYLDLYEKPTELWLYETKGLNCNVYDADVISGVSKVWCLGEKSEMFYINLTTKKIITK